DPDASAITGLRLDHEAGPVELKRPEGSTTLSISIPGQVDQHVALPMRGLAECLIEDLRRLDPDEAYAAALAAIFDVEVSCPFLSTRIRKRSRRSPPLGYVSTSRTQRRCARTFTSPSPVAAWEPPCSARCRIPSSPER